MKLWSYNINFASFKIVEGCIVKKKHQRLELHFSPDRNTNVYHMALIWNWNSEYLCHSHIRYDQIVGEFKRHTAFPYQIPVTLDNMGMVWGVSKYVSFP